MQAICLALLLVLAVASATTCGSASWTFAAEKEACDATTLCQNSLYCINGTCTLIRDGDNCTEFGCGDGNFLSCVNGKCLVTSRAVGDPCDQDAECLSMKCDNTTATCAATLKKGDACDLSTGTSAWACPEACITANGTTVCADSIPVGGDCTETQAQWLQNPLRTGDFASLYPEFTCAAGSACIANATTGGYNCQRIFAVTQNKPCQYAGVDGTCLYNLTCQPNATLGTELYCQPYPAAPAKGQAQCDFASQATAPQCPFGQACQCSAVGANATCQPFVGGNLCTDYLTDFIECVAKHGCPYVPALYPFTEDAGWPFVMEAAPHTCAYLECRVAHANFLCCQNNHTLVSGSAAAVAKYSPINQPGDGYCKLNGGWPNWVIPVIVLSGIVVVVSVIVIIYVVARRRPDADYDPINK